MINLQDVLSYTSKKVLPGKVSGSPWQGHKLTLGVCDNQKKETFSCIQYKRETCIKDFIANAYLYEKMKIESYIPIRIQDPQQEKVQTVYVPQTLAAALDIVSLCQFTPVMGDPVQEKEFLDSVANVKRVMDRLKDNEFFLVVNSVNIPSDTSSISDMSEMNDSLESEFSTHQKGAIAWKMNNRWKVEPVTATAAGGFAVVCLTENVALRVLFDQMSSSSTLEDRSLSQVHCGPQVIELLNPEGTLVGIQRPRMGLLLTGYKIDEQKSFTFNVGQVASERCKGDCRMGGYSQREVPKMCAQVVEGLKTLHDKGVYHLDIKPANILYDGEGIVYLADFDGALFLSDEIENFLFTPTMMTWADYLEISDLLNHQESFAETEKHNLLSQLDIFALGSTFYQLACLAKGEEVDFPYKIGVTTSFDETREAKYRSPFAGALFDLEVLKENMRSVYDEKQIDMILRMLSENRAERPTAEEIGAVFPKALFEGSITHENKDYFAGVKEDEVEFPPLIQKIQRVFNINYPTLIARADGAIDHLLRA